MVRRALIAGATFVCLAAACANPPTPQSERTGSDAPAVGRIVCEEDGSTTVSTPQITAQPDGVHVHVESHLDEPASINGWGFDVDTGTSRWTLGVAPGIIPTACWRFSDHDKGEPPTQPIEVLDPGGMFVSSDVECEQAMAWTADYVSAFDDVPPISLDSARALIKGLRESDVVRYGGYPEEQDRGVVVIRGDTVVAALGFARFEGEWSSPGGTICSDSGITVRGV